jgi:hypothetical protein
LLSECNTIAGYNVGVDATTYGCNSRTWKNIMTPDNVNHRFEVLKLASEMLNEEYKYRRATEHNTWLIDRHIAWVNEHRILPHPPFPPYPTPLEIMEAAAGMLAFVKPEDMPTIVSAVVPAPPVPETIVDIAPNIVPEVTVEPVIEDQPAAGKSFLPGWIRRTIE